jgi:hypothetical protein
MISDVCKFTNQEIDQQNIKYSSNPSWCKPTAVAEIRGLIVILYLCAAKKDTHMDAQVLWDPASGSDVYRSVMPLQRYRFLIQCLRFDDKSMRNKEDSFVHIQGLWSQFVENCTAYHSPSVHPTIDEQLLGFGDRCPFRVYIPNKPDKYGIKIVMICDSHTCFISGMLYLGKATPNGHIRLADYFIMELSKSVQGLNRNITVDNWFSSLPLFKTILDKKLTMVGTL